MSFFTPMVGSRASQDSRFPQPEHPCSRSPSAATGQMRRGAKRAGFTRLGSIVCQVSLLRWPRRYKYGSSRALLVKEDNMGICRPSFLGVPALAILAWCLTPAPTAFGGPIFQVIIGGTAIVDNGKGDMDPTVDRVVFKTTDPMTGYIVSGTFELGGGGGLITIGKPDFTIKLTDFLVGRPAGAAGGPLTITFQDDFTPAAGTPLAPSGAMGITGTLSNDVKAGGKGFLGNGTSVSFDATVNGTHLFNPRAAPPLNGPITATVAAVMGGVRPTCSPFLVNVGRFKQVARSR